MTELFKKDTEEWTDAALELSKQAERSLQNILEDFLEKHPGAKIREIAYVLDSAVEGVTLRELAKRRREHNKRILEDDPYRSV
jgi:hypothetical protein